MSPYLDGIAGYDQKEGRGKEGGLAALRNPGKSGDYLTYFDLIKPRIGGKELAGSRHFVGLTPTRKKTAGKRSNETIFPLTAKICEHAIPPFVGPTNLSGTKKKKKKEEVLRWQAFRTSNLLRRSLQSPEGGKKGAGGKEAVKRQRKEKGKEPPDRPCTVQTRQLPREKKTLGMMLE